MNPKSHGSTLEETWLDQTINSAVTTVTATKLPLCYVNLKNKNKNNNNINNSSKGEMWFQKFDLKFFFWLRA